MLAFVLLAGAAPLAARQNPPTEPPKEVIPLDTMVVRKDTIVADTLDAAADSVSADSVRPAPRLVAFSNPGPTGWTSGAWEWTREELLESSAFTLIDLLERVPGLTAIRSGWYGMPQAIAALGAAGGGIRVILDGYAFDPLGAASPDLTSIALADLRHVRIERRAGGLRIELETLAPRAGQPYSMIQAGQGDRLNTQLFRGIFMAPRVLGGPLSLGIERLDTQGIAGRAPAVSFDGWFTWGLMRDSLGVQLGYYRTTLTRGAEGPYPGESTRQDWMLRVRGAPEPGLTAEAFAGLSTLEVVGAGAADPGTAEPDTVVPFSRIQTLQAGLRAQYRSDAWWTHAVVRGRDHNALPEVTASFGGGVDLPGSVRLGGGIDWEVWDQGERGLAYRANAAWRPFTGLEVFADFSFSHRGVPFLEDPTGAPSFTERKNVRLGAFYANGGLRVGAAMLKLSADSVAPFGLPFDDQMRGLMPGGEVRGIEARLRLPIIRDPLALEATYTEWLSGQLWPYLPLRSWRAALTYHGRPMANADFEIIARVERERRGGMIVPSPDGGLASVPARTAFDFYLQIRIRDLRAFLRWDNMFHRLNMRDLPGRILPGQRVIYGVKWSFWN